MSPAIIMLFDAILKIAPEVVSLIQEFVGNDNTIPPHKIPEIMSKIADVAKNSPSLQNSKASDSDSNNSH